MSPILFFYNFFYLHRSGKNIFTDKSSSSGIYQYFNSSVRRVKETCFTFDYTLKYAMRELKLGHSQEAFLIFGSRKMTRDTHI